MNEQSSTNAASSTDRASPKKRKGLWWKIPAGIFTALAILAVIGGDDTLDLRVERGGGSFGAGMVGIQNTGSQPIIITKIAINNRDDCAPTMADTQTDSRGRITYNRKAVNRHTLRVGEAILVSSTCSIVRITIVSDQGTATFTFD
jgi:hypothetical protein